MQIGTLDHVNIRTAQLDAMRAWYAEFLDLKAGFRPKFENSGAWLYAGEKPVVHLVEVPGDTGVGSEVDLKLEHFALSATGRDAFETKLKATQTPYETNEITEIGIVQFNVWDPDGNHIHIDFPIVE